MSICNLLGCLEVYISFPLVSLKMDTSIFVCKLEWKEPQHEQSPFAMSEEQQKVLKDDTLSWFFCHKSVKLRLNFLTLGVTSHSVSEVNKQPCGNFHIGRKETTKNLLPLLLKKALKQSSGFQ